MSEQLRCSNCNNIYKTTSGLNKHLKNCVKPQVIQSTTTSSEAEMMIQLIKQNDEQRQELIRLKNELARRDEEVREVKPITIELPYDNDQLTKIIYKYNFYTRQYSIRRNGFSPKDFKSWYTLKYFNVTDYPDTKVQFYKKCLEEILKNIPNEKLPYRVRDYKRRIYDIYNYSEKMWMKGNVDDLIQLIIKKIIALIQSSFFSAINVFNELNTSDFHALENRKIDPTSFNRLRMELQSELTYNFSLPDYDDDVSEEDKYKFYKNFIKILNERLSSGIEVEINEDEFKEYEQPIKHKKSRPTLTKVILEYENNEEEEYNLEDYKICNSDDEGYETDTKENPYFDMNYDSS